LGGSEVRAGDRGRVLAGVAIVALLSAGYVGASYAATSGAAGLTDTTPPTDTTPTPEPTPDPAPAPKPKPTPKPSRPPVSHPAPVYHPPVVPQTHTRPRAYIPTTAHAPATPPVARHPKPKVVHHRTHRRKKAAVQRALAPTKTQPSVSKAKPSFPFAGGAVTAAATRSTSNSARNTLVIAGLGLAAFLFFLLWAVPTTPARFTSAGRAVMHHQTELVITGVGTLLLTAMLFFLTRAT
jgi:type IV secretory pathway VirB10-like protein